MHVNNTDFSSENTLRVSKYKIHCYQKFHHLQQFFTNYLHCDWLIIEIYCSKKFLVCSNPESPWSSGAQHTLPHRLQYHLYRPSCSQCYWPWPVLWDRSPTGSDRRPYRCSPSFSSLSVCLPASVTLPIWILSITLSCPSQTIQLPDEGFNFPLAPALIN